MKSRMHVDLAIRAGVCGLALMFGQVSVAEDAKEPSVRDLLNQLSSVDTSQAAVKALIARGDEAKKQLMGEAIEGTDLARRGWAIVVLSEIGGKDVDDLMKKIHSDSNQPKLVRNWAAGARVNMTDTAEGLIEKASLVAAFPALGRPIGKRLLEKLAADETGASPEGMLAVTLRVPQLRTALAPAIMNLGPKKLTTVMTSAKDQNVRRNAAAYLGALAGQSAKGAEAVGETVAGAYAFDSNAKDVTWKGGPLFLPSINWTKADAQAVVGNLIAWHLWCDVRGKKAEQKQIHNNIRSLGLARVAGYQSPGFQEVGTVRWLQIWAKTAGKDELKRMLKEQGLEDNAKYAGVLN